MTANSATPAPGRPLARSVAAAAAILGAAGWVVGQSAGGSPPDPARASVFGTSVQGRPLRSLVVGDPRATRRLLVIGCIHGNECAGRAVTRRLVASSPPAGSAIWLVHDANPDGAAMNRRQNARGVDLNRNFPYLWRPLDRPGGTYWSGPRALSEPESRALRSLIVRVRPHVTIWYHQHMRLVDLSGGDPALQRRYARLVGLPVRRLARPPGSVSSWQNRTFPGTTAFVVELAAGPLTAAGAARHAAAVRALASGPPRSTPATAAGEREPPSRPSAMAPAILQRRIPFGAARRAQMARYAQRHYGRRSWRLPAPRAIVVHYSVTGSARAVWNTFAPNRRDPELHELPGTCAHFVVARDGTIQQLVDLGTMCRHAVGLNHVAIGVEHVGFSEREVMDNPRQLAASLRLTRWLRCTRAIRLRDVIGHAESLSSPWHLERIARLRDQTHSDFGPRPMRAYRARLARMPCPTAPG